MRREQLNRDGLVRVTTTQGRLDRTSFVPLYFQLAEILKERLESSRWEAGARFQSEGEIAAEFSVSRTVVRPALALLESDGQLVRLKGRGTFVAAPKQGVHIQGLSRLLSDSNGQDMNVDILAARSVNPEGPVAEVLQLDPSSAKVAHITARIRRGGAPVFICNSFSALRRLPWILDAAKSRTRGDPPVAPGIRFDCTEVSVETASVSEWEAQQLNLAPGDPCFLASCLEHAHSEREPETGGPAEFARLVLRTDLRLELRSYLKS